MTTDFINTDSLNTDSIDTKASLEPAGASFATFLLRQAREQGYAIAAFNAVNLETAQAIVRAAEEERAPVILQISENAARYGGLKPLHAVAQTLKAAASVPVVLHYDHAEKLESALSAVKLGFGSVMLEGADLTPQENVRQLKALVEAAHLSGASVEGEFEIVSKDGREGARLEPEQVRDLSAASGCDTVAVDIGSKHKMTEKSAHLDLERLETLAKLVPQPLVLHGSSGVPEEDLSDAVSLGIAKVNIATELMLTFTESVRESLSDPDLHDPRKYLGAARGAMQARAQALIRLLGSADKAG